MQNICAPPSLKTQQHDQHVNMWKITGRTGQRQVQHTTDSVGCAKDADADADVDVNVDVDSDVDVDVEEYADVCPLGMWMRYECACASMYASMALCLCAHCWRLPVSICLCAHVCVFVSISMSHMIVFPVTSLSSVVP
jgi:hypothetical protein